MWQMGGFGPMPGQVHHFLQVKDEQDRLLRSGTLPEGNAPALRSARQTARAGPLAGGRRRFHCRFRHPRLGLAPRAASGRSGRVSERQALVRDDDGTPGDREGIHGRAEVSLSRDTRALYRSTHAPPD